MNKPDKAGEPSMDDILASIRKIIADEPGRSSAAGDRAVANPLIEPRGRPAAASSPQPLDERLLPPMDRFSDALKVSSSRGFDADLEDLLEGDGPSSSRPGEAGAIEAGETPGEPPAPPSTASAEKSKAGDGIRWSALGSSSNGGAAPEEKAESAASPTETGDSAAADAVREAPAKRGGFYPPAERAVSEAAATDAIAAALAGAEPAAGEVRANATLQSASSPVIGAELSTAFPAASVASAEVQRQSSAEPLLAAAVPVTPAEASHHAAAVAAGPRPLNSTGRATGAAGGHSAPRLDSPFPFDPVPPLGPTSAASRPMAAAGSVGGGMDRETQAAAASALGALAAGLAASSATEQARAHAAQAGGTAPSMAPAGSPPMQPVQQRTLEDIVADMIRPMLERWVSENMPRIMEKALRGEVMKNGGKPGFRG